MKTLLTGLLILVLLCGCAVGRQFDVNKAERIKPGMTRAEVVALIGHNPGSTGISCNNADCYEMMTWFYAVAYGKTKALSVRIKNGVVE